MSKQEERRALELFDRYTDEALRGQQPSIKAFLDECPESEIEHLQDALQGLDVLLNRYYCSQVKQSTVDATLKEIQEIRQKRKRFTEAVQRSSHLNLGEVGEYQEYLSKVLSMEDTTETSHGFERAPPLILNRGEGTRAMNAYALGDMWLQVTEKRVAIEAEKVLHQTQVTQLPINVKLVAERLFLIVKEVALVGIEGCLQTDGQIGGILINRNIGNEQRRRFTCGHEVGHFVLHRHLSHLVDRTNSIFNFSPMIDEVEREANIFASALLMPLFLLPKDVGSTPPTFERAEEIRGQCDVSLQAALRRIVQLSDWRCALVSMKNGVVEWATGSQYFNGRVLNRPHVDTAAKLLFRSRDITHETVELPSSAWVEGELVEEEGYIREESHRLGDEHVYSLLTVVEPN